MIGGQEDILSGVLGSMWPGLAVQGHLGTFQASHWGKGAARRNKESPFSPPGSAHNVKRGTGVGLALSTRLRERALREAGGHQEEGSGCVRPQAPYYHL